MAQQPNPVVVTVAIHLAKAIHVTMASFCWLWPNQSFVSCWMRIGHRLLMKGCLGPTKQLAIWGTFVHAPHAPQLRACNLTRHVTVYTDKPSISYNNY